MPSFFHEHISSCIVCIRLFIRKNKLTASLEMQASGYPHQRQCLWILQLGEVGFSWSVHNKYSSSEGLRTAPGHALQCYGPWGSKVRPRNRGLWKLKCTLWLAPVLKCRTPYYPLSSFPTRVATINCDSQFAVHAISMGPIHDLYDDPKQ